MHGLQYPQMEPPFRVQAREPLRKPVKHVAKPEEFWLRRCFVSREFTNLLGLCALVALILVSVYINKSTSTLNDTLLMAQQDMKDFRDTQAIESVGVLAKRFTDTWLPIIDNTSVIVNDVIATLIAQNATALADGILGAARDLTAAVERLSSIFPPKTTA